MNTDEEVLAEEVESEEENRLELKVEIEEIGPCKKHVSVAISREDINTLHALSVEELAEEAEVPGFRIGKAPAKLLEKRFRTEINSQLKQKLLLQSMEQVTEEFNLEPISEPDLEVENLEIPEEGDFEYEFEIEVRPTFEMPDFSAMKIERKVSESTEDDIESQLEDYLRQYGTYIPHEGAASLGDYLIVDMKFSKDGESFQEFKETSVELCSTLRFHDAELEDFDKLMEGVKADETRKIKVTISIESGQVEMRGEVLDLEITVLDVKKIEVPSLDDKDFLERINAESEEGLREQIKSSLERQAEYEQRESAREQVLAQINESSNWDLPEDLVNRQAENALRREILEMKQAGFTEQQLAARESQIRQQSISSTRESLKQHFILDRFADEEDIEVSSSELDMQVQMMAWQQGESPRKVRARMVKSGMMEHLEAQMREQRAIDLILEKSQFVDLPTESTSKDRVATIDKPICPEAAIVTTDSEVESDEEEE